MPDGVGTAEYLEGVQSEAEGLILDQNAAEAQRSGQPRKPRQRSGSVFAECIVKIADFLCLFYGQRGKIGSFPCRLACRG